jgi:hypothetical protein
MGPSFERIVRKAAIALISVHRLHSPKNPTCLDVPPIRLSTGLFLSGVQEAAALVPHAVENGAH